jgi:hypothetical protein
MTGIASKNILGFHGFPGVMQERALKPQVHESFSINLKRIPAPCVPRIAGRT